MTEVAREGARSPDGSGSHRSLLQKVVAGVSFALLAVLVGLLLPFLYIQRDDLLEEEARLTELYGRLLSREALSDLATGEAMERVRSEIETSQPHLDIRAAFLDGGGEPLFEEKGATPIPGWIRSRVVRAAASYDASITILASPTGTHLFQPVPGAGARPAGVIYLLNPSADVDRRVLSLFFRNLAFCLLVVFIIGVFIILLIHSIVLRPVSRMIEANVALYEGREEEAFIPDPDIPDDELGDIMRSRNQIYRRMLDYHRNIQQQNLLLEHQSQELERWSEELAREVEAKSDDLVRARDRLVRNEKLAAMGRLAAGVAHEINNPLQTIAIYTEDLLERFEDGELELASIREQFPDGLRMIEEQAYRCKRITNQLLNFARQQAFTLEELNPNEVVEEILPLIEPKARQEGVRIRRDLEEKPGRVRVDRTQLSQVVVNLVENGIDALAGVDDPELLIRTRSEPPVGLPDRILLEVVDNGSGIPADEQARVFDPFFTTKPVGQGTGLGLSIVYGIVERLKGRIELDSEEGKGTTFRVILPAVGESGAIPLEPEQD